MNPERALTPERAGVVDSGSSLPQHGDGSPSARLLSPKVCANRTGTRNPRYGLERAIAADSLPATPYAS